MFLDDAKIKLSQFKTLNIKRYHKNNLILFWFENKENISKVPKYLVYENVFYKYLQFHLRIIIQNKNIDEFMSMKINENEPYNFNLDLNSKNIENFSFVFSKLLDIKLIINEHDHLFLYHYTTCKNILKIIQNKTLLFKNIESHRDSNEKDGLLYFGFGEQEIMKIFENKNVFTFSVTDYYDDLGMWVLYTTGISYETYSYPHFFSNNMTGKTNHDNCELIENMGVCCSINKFYLISFLFDKFNKKTFSFEASIDDNFIFQENVSFSKIHYEKKNYWTFIHSVNQWISKHSEYQLNSDNIKILASLSYKHNWYRYEKESRFIVIENKENDKFVENVMVEGLNINQLIEKVYISPYCKKCFCSLDCDNKMCSVNKLMNLCKENRIMCILSEIKFKTNRFYESKGGSDIRLK